MSFFLSSIIFGTGLAGGLVLASIFWRRRLIALHFAWQVNFSRVVSATVAHHLGGHVDENGIIHLGNHGEEPPKEGLN